MTNQMVRLAICKILNLKSQYSWPRWRRRWGRLWGMPRIRISHSNRWLADLVVAQMKLKTRTGMISWRLRGQRWLVHLTRLVENWLKSRTTWSRIAWLPAGRSSHKTLQNISQGINQKTILRTWATLVRSNQWAQWKHSSTSLSTEEASRTHPNSPNCQRLFHPRQALRREKCQEPPPCLQILPILSSSMFSKWPSPHRQSQTPSRERIGACSAIPQDGQPMAQASSMYLPRVDISQPVRDIPMSRILHLHRSMELSHFHLMMYHSPSIPQITICLQWGHSNLQQ